MSLNLAVDLKLGWDAQNYWLMKSLNFTNGGNILDLQNFPRPDYPILAHIYGQCLEVFRFWTMNTSVEIFYLYIFLASIYSIINFIEISDLNKTILFLLVVTILIIIIF